MPGSEPQRTAGSRVRARTLIGLLALASGVAQGFGRFSYALLLPAVNADLLHSYVLAGLLGTINLAAYLAGTITVGLTAARFHPAAVVRFGLVVSSLGLATLAAAPTAAVLFVGMVLAGGGGALIWVPAPGIAGSSVAPARRGLAVGLVGTGIGMAVTFSSVLTAVTHVLYGGQAWRQVWAIEAVIGVLSALAAARWLHPPALPESGAMRVSELRAVPGWVGATVGYAGYGLAVAIYMSFLVTALTSDGGFSLTHASAVFALVGVAMGCGGVLLGRVSDVLGRQRTLIGAYALMSVAVGLVLLHAEPWAVLSAVAFGIPMAGIPAVLVAHLADHLQPRAIAAAFGALTFFFGLAQLAGPQLGGWIADQTSSFNLAFMVAAVAGLVGLLAASAPQRARPSP